MNHQQELLRNFALILITQMAALKRDLSGKNLPRNLAEAINNFDSLERNYLNSPVGLGVDEMISAVKGMAHTAQGVAFLVNGAGLEVGSGVAEDLRKESVSVIEQIDKGDAFFSTISSSDKSVGESGRIGVESIVDFISSTRRELDELGRRLSSVSMICENLEAGVVESKGKADKLYEAASRAYEVADQEISLKREQIDKILGHVSGRTLAGDFDRNAVGEKRNADLLRFFSIVCMFFTVLIVGITFYESAVGDFDWKIAVSRASMALVLSIPAGYLARESSRHRYQQQLYLQTSLSLKALPAYIASLPDEMQHKLKAEMTQRIFAMGVSQPGDLGVLNVQDLMLELIKRFEVKK